MTPENYNIEKTANGMPYVIFGIELPVKPKQYIYRAVGSEYFERWVKPWLPKNIN
jgi:hypothetical protein